MMAGFVISIGRNSIYKNFKKDVLSGLEKGKCI